MKTNICFKASEFTEDIDIYVSVDIRTDLNKDVVEKAVSEAANFLKHKIESIQITAKMFKSTQNDSIPF